MWADGTLTVDFESETTAYTDWVFKNFASTVSKSEVPAHGGLYIGTTNGQQTGSLQTKDKIASPNTIKFYITRATTSTTSSSWKVQVSSDKNSWTDVATASATSMKIGEWTEVTQSLTNYNDVYVRIYYTGTSAVRCIDDVTLTYSPAVTYDINIANNIANGSITASSTTAKEGATVTLTATPEDDYKLVSWDITNASTSEAITVTDNKFTMPAANVNVSASFAKKVKYTISWSINDNITSQDIYEDTDLEFPTDIPNPVVGNTKTFVGWTESEAIEGEPTLVTSGKATENKTYYAVFANKTSGTYTLDYEADNLGSSNGWGKYGQAFTYQAVGGGEWIIKANKYTGMRLNQGQAASIKVPNCPGYITSVTIKASYNQTTNFSTEDYSGTAIDVIASTGSMTGTIDLSDKRVKTGYLWSGSGANIFTKVVVKYEDKSNYTTTITPAPSSVNLNAKGYASFSSEYELSIDGAKAYTAKVDEEAKTITWNAIEDNIIPANEGVLLKGDAGEKATLAVSTTNKSNIADNDMRSNLVAKPKSELDGYIYVLSGENIIRLSDTGTVGANKAYFNLSQYITNAESSTGAKTFTMIWNDGGIATGINNASTSTSKGIVYNLTGQHVNANAKGIVIIGGKKYINK